MTLLSLDRYEWIGTVAVAVASSTSLTTALTVSCPLPENGTVRSVDV
jgi:hypothetical protein